MKLLVILLLLGPAAKKEWSKAHHVGISVPDGWKVTARDQERRAFVLEGPQLQRGRSTAVVWNAGSADRVSLKARVDELVKQVQARAGWRLVARVRKTVGPYPAIRVGLDFVDEGRKGRARFTVFLAGGNFHVVELNAPASHFPGAAYDRLEKSFELRWVERSFLDDLRLRTPHGWTFEAKGGRCTVMGPALGVGRTLMRLGPGRVPKEMLAGAREGPKLSFLGKTRETQLVDRKQPGALTVRMLHVHADGITATVMIPASVWDDGFPTAAAVLGSVKRVEAD